MGHTLSTRVRTAIGTRDSIITATRTPTAIGTWVTSTRTPTAISTRDSITTATRTLMFTDIRPPIIIDMCVHMVTDPRPFTITTCPVATDTAPDVIVQGCTTAILSHSRSLWVQSRARLPALAPPDVRYASISDEILQRRNWPLRAMCGRLRVGRTFFTCAVLGRCGHVFGLY
jgi:hypothetical protein